MATYACFADSSETPSINDTVMKPTLPEATLDAVILTTRSNPHSKDIILNKETNTANRMIRYESGGNSEEEETHSDWKDDYTTNSIVSLPSKVSETVQVRDVSILHQWMDLNRY